MKVLKENNAKSLIVLIIAAIKDFVTEENVIVYMDFTEKIAPKF